MTTNIFTLLTALDAAQRAEDWPAAHSAAAALKNSLEDIYEGLEELVSLDPDDDDDQELIAEHTANVEMALELLLAPSEVHLMTGGLTGVEYAVLASHDNGEGLYTAVVKSPVATLAQQ